MAPGGRRTAWRAVLSLALAVGGCASGGGNANEGSTTPVDRPPYELDIGEEAAALGEAAGLDIDREIRAIADIAFARLPHIRQVMIRVSIDGERAIPEIGIGGFTNPIDGWYPSGSTQTLPSLRALMSCGPGCT